jgi:hypothetical protein
MSVTTRSLRAIKARHVLPKLPPDLKPQQGNEVREVRALITALGGKPLSQATRSKLIEAGCYAWPEE